MLCNYNKNGGDVLLVQVMSVFFVACGWLQQSANQPKMMESDQGKRVWTVPPLYLYSSEPAEPNSELVQVTVWPELRFLRLEASSPALKDTDTYLPMRGSK